MAKVLVVEDDLVFSYLIQHHLELNHYIVDAVKTGAEGLACLEQRIFDLAILDWMLPDMLGVEICKKFRAQGGTTPILLLTAKNSSEEKALGLDSGADDYLVKPFDPPELLARLRALLRRPAGFTGKLLRVRDVELDTTTYRVTRAGKEIDLALKEIAILELLMKHPNQRFTAEIMLQRLWRSDASASVETVRTHMKTLRKKLNDTNENALIRTTRHLGYRIVDDDTD
jgi:two-component system phosphate regulon response regulator PhoB